MQIIKCSGAIFIDDSGNILLEDRRKFSKNGEEWGFFGGHAEDGETEEDTLKREIKEEINYEITGYKHFKEYVFTFKDRKYIHQMYVAPTPDMSKIKVHDNANAKIFLIEEALKLRTIDVDKQILIDVQEYIKHNHIHKPYI